jgi:parallel beta-helix repeat protein
MIVKKNVFGIMLTLFFIGLLTLACDIKPSESEPKTIIVPDDYPTIQEAINYASDGDTVFVRAGTYPENIIVNKSVSLVGESPENTIIDGQRVGTVIYVNTSYITIANFTVQNGAGFNGRPYAGISVYTRSYLNITNNIIKNNNVGIDCEIGPSGSHITIFNNSILSNPNGIIISNTNNVVIANNVIIAYNLGLSVGGGTYNEILNNFILSENKGIELSWMTNSTVTWNNITAYGGTVIKLYHASGCLISNNLIIGGKNRNDGDYGVFLYSSDENRVIYNKISLCKWNGIYALEAENDIIENNTVTESYSGVTLQISKYNTILGNNLVNVTIGLGLFDYSDSNIIMNNNIISFELGIYADNSWYNKIYHNNFMGFGSQVSSKNSVNTWDDGYPSGGNYWSEYVIRYPNAKELDGSGLWDTPYIIDENNQDRYPLMYPYGSQTYKLTITTTVGGTTNPELGIHTYLNGTVVSVTAIPEANYVFDHWELDGTPAGSTNPIKVVMTANHTLQAVFLPGYTLTIISATGGTTDPIPGAYMYVDGTQVTVTAIPSIGFSFDYWLLDGVKRTDNPIMVIMDSNHTLEAYFIDDIPPEISEPWQDPPANNVQPLQNVTVWVNATDYGTGIENVTLWYSLDNGTSWIILNMTELPIPSDTWITYEATIQGYENCTWVTYKIIAYDNAGNNATKDNNGYGYQYHVIPEFPSTLVFVLFILTTLIVTLFWKTKRKQQLP